MCGLTGILGPDIKLLDLQILEELSYVSALRGTDGTGILQARSYGSPRDRCMVEKSQHEVSYFKWFHKWAKGGNRKVFDGISNNLFAVHTRGASRGSITPENAHPFEFGNLVGMHNGTLKNKKYEHYTKTDSELLFEDINDNGLVPVLTALDPKSAYALVIYDKKTEEITFVRNQERELFFCFAENRSVMYWASESWMLRGILGRNYTKVNDNSIYSFTPGYIYTIIPRLLRKGNVEAFKRVKLIPDKPKEEELKEETRTVINNVIPLNIVNKSNKIPPTVYCCNNACNKELDLVARYFGNKIGDNVFLCKDCQDSIPNMNSQSLN